MVRCGHFAGVFAGIFAGVRIRSIWRMWLISCPATMRTILDGFLAALGMLAVLLPLIGGKRFEERNIGFAHYAVQFDGFAGIAFLVVSGDDPGVLIVGLDGGSGASEDGAHAPADYDFDVSEVSEDFGDGPLVGGGALAEFGGGDAIDEANEFF